MLILGINEFLRNIKRNIFVVLQLVGLFLVVLVTFSSIYEQIKMYKGVTSFLDRTGRLMQFTTTNVDVTEGKLKGVEHVICSRNNMLSNSNHQAVTLVTYDPDLTPYKPRMVKGKWCENVKEKKNLIRASVSEKFPYEVKVGDVFEFGGCSFYITGFYKSNEALLGISGLLNLTGAMSYRQFYLTEEDYMGYPLMMIAFDDFNKLDGYCNSGLVVIDYKDDISEEDMKYNDKVLAEECEVYENINMLDTKPVYEHSKKILMIKIVPSIMVLAVILLFAVISILVTSAISVKYEKRNYGIYFIAGNTWRRTIFIAAIHHFIEILLAIVMAFSVRALLVHLHIDIISVDIYKSNLISVIGIAVFIEIISIILPYIMLHKMTPVEQIKQE